MRRRSDLPPTDQQPWSEMIPADSFYARLAEWRDVLVKDEDYAPLYKDRRGAARPYLPRWWSSPCSWSITTTAPTRRPKKDAFRPQMEARLGSRWKRRVRRDGVVPFQTQTAECGLERTLFERLVKAARETGVLAKDAAQLLDSSHILGAAGARDTYTLIRGAIRKLLRSLGYTTADRAGSVRDSGGTSTRTLGEAGDRLGRC